MLSCIRIALLVLLCFGTILFSTVYHQHLAKGPNLLSNPDFRYGLTDWRATSSVAVSTRTDTEWGGTLVITNVPPGERQSTSVTQIIDVPYGQQLVILSCEARVLNVVPGKKPWEKARVALFPLTMEGKPRYDTPHTLVALEGSVPWTKVEKVFRVPEESMSLSVTAQILNASGTLEVRNIALRSAVEDPSYSKWRFTLALVWFIAGLWIIWPLVRATRERIGRVCILVTGGIILAGVLMPATIKYAVTPSWLLPESEAPGSFKADFLLAMALFRFELLPTELSIYKLAHFFLFAIIGYLLINRRPYKAPVWMQAGILTLFALATESMQVLVAGRDGSLGDVVIDMSGACCGMFFTIVMRHRYAQKPKTS